LIIACQSGFCPLSQVGFVGIRQALPQNRIKFELGEFFQSPNEFTLLKLFG